MTAKISQQVVPRQARRLRHWSLAWRPSHHSRRLHAQRGNITPNAIGATVGVSALIILATLGFMYLQQVLHTASQGTDIHALETQLIDLKQKKRELELQGANLRSLQTVEERVQRLNLVPTDHVSYLVSAPDHVAALP